MIIGNQMASAAAILTTNIIYDVIIMIMYGTDAAWHASTFLKHTPGRPSDCEAAVHHSWHSCAHDK